MFAVPSWQTDTKNDLAKKRKIKKIIPGIVKKDSQNTISHKKNKTKNKVNIHTLKELKTKLTTHLNSNKEFNLVAKTAIKKKRNKTKQKKVESNNEGKYVKLNSEKSILNSKYNNENNEDDNSLGTEKKENASRNNKNETKNKNLLSKPIFDKKKLKKERLKKMLTSDSFNRNVVKSSSQNLRNRMMEKLKAAQFRFLNEKLYTSNGSEARELFDKDPESFKIYHEGYQQQVKKWPVNPLDIIAKKISKMPKTTQVADLGCGEGALAKQVSQPVRSFDLVAGSPGVEQCDMARTPLLTASIGVAVYCLSLMGTDLTKYLVEANRILKTGGLLMIAEVESRFSDVDAFVKDVHRLGFKLTKLDKSHEVFFFLEFKKVNEAPVKKNKLPYISLKPCLYKRR